MATKKKAAVKDTEEVVEKVEEEVTTEKVKQVAGTSATTGLGADWRKKELSDNYAKVAKRPQDIH